MFSENDKYLNKARKIIISIFSVLLWLALIGGIITLLAGLGKKNSAIRICGISLISSGILFAFMKLIFNWLFSLHLDIKYIRNKLYNVKNNTTQHDVGKPTPPTTKPTKPTTSDKTKNVLAGFGISDDKNKNYY